MNPLRTSWVGNYTLGIIKPHSGAHVHQSVLGTLFAQKGSKGKAKAISMFLGKGNATRESFETNLNPGFFPLIRVPSGDCKSHCFGAKSAGL